jgi:hypothetical protein
MQQAILLASAVECADGQGGHVKAVVLDPQSHRLEYLVIHRGLFGGHDPAVPAITIRDATPTTVTLTLHVEELKQHAEVELKVPGTGIRQRSIPENCVILSASTPLTDAAGQPLGHFHGVIVDDTRQVRSILRAGDGDLGIPIERISLVSEVGITVEPAEQERAISQ